MSDASQGSTIQGRTLYDKVWDAHVVRSYDDGASLIYIDRHLVQEVSSPQAFAGMQAAGRSLRRADHHLAVADHAVPTVGRDRPMPDGLASRQLRRLEDNVRAFGINYIPMKDRRHGIVHVIGPELGFTLPGATLVCGDSHTCTHGALGALSFGIGASECEMVFATQCLRQTRQKRMLVFFTGVLPEGVAAKDAVLAFIRAVGVGGSAGYAIEYGGPGIEGLGIEARMTLCNMAVEAGSRVAMVAPDDLTFAYLEGRPYAPRGAEFERALDHWRSLPSDPDARFDQIVPIDLAAVAPHVTWGTTPEESAPIDGRVPDPDAEADANRRARLRRSLDYMGLAPGTALQDIPVDRVFIGSCTNARLDDLRAAGRVVAGRRVASSVKAIVVPGSASVRLAAEAEGLDKLFRDAGFEWRESGCSMCVAMNDDRLAPGERCASTSNRNFEGRQGRGGRTHLMSPPMAAAAAITGHLADVRTLLP
jgi:3-isopropylmalate/(R)-2-methylmalate dehydratase large subunit